MGDKCHHSLDVIRTVNLERVFPCQRFFLELAFLGPDDAGIVEQGQREQAFGIVQREPQRDKSAHAVAANMAFLNTHRIEKITNARRLRGHIIITPGLPDIISKTWQIRRNQPIFSHHFGGVHRPVVLVAAKAMQQHQGFAIRGTALKIGPGQIANLDRFFLQLAFSPQGVAQETIQAARKKRIDRDQCQHQNAQNGQDYFYCLHLMFLSPLRVGPTSRSCRSAPRLSPVR